MPVEFTTSYLKDAASVFLQYKRVSERAIGQVRDEDLHRKLDPDSNSIAILMRHIGGNLRSRWTDFLTTDGEKPWRDRDSEFADPSDSGNTRESLMNHWERGWSALFATLESLTDEDLPKQITIRSEPHSVMQAITRSLAHVALHSGQIVLLAKHFQGQDWQTLTVPKNKSAEFNQRTMAGTPRPNLS